MAQLEDKVIELVTMTYRKKPGEVSCATSFVDDLDTRSILKVGLISLVEDEFDITFPLIEADRCQTVGEMIEEIEKRSS